MSLNTADITSRLRRYLDRRQPPRRIEGKAQAEADEIRALTAALERHAPRGADALAAWWPVFEAALGEIAAGGLWPTEREIKDAATAARPALPKVSEEISFDPFEIAAGKMRDGQPIGEGFLYGRQACELIRRGLVDRETMTAYRSGAFIARRAVQGEAAALEWEAEAKQRHEDAKAMTRDTSPATARHIDVNPARMMEARHD